MKAPGIGQHPGQVGLPMPLAAFLATWPFLFGHLVLLFSGGCCLGHCFFRVAWTTHTALVCVWGGGGVKEEARKKDVCKAFVRRGQRDPMSIRRNFYRFALLVFLTWRLRSRSQRRIIRRPSVWEPGGLGRFRFFRRARCSSRMLSCYAQSSQKVYPWMEMATGASNNLMRYRTV